MTDYVNHVPDLDDDLLEDILGEDFDDDNDDLLDDDQDADFDDDDDDLLDDDQDADFDDDDDDLLDDDQDEEFDDDDDDLLDDDQDEDFDDDDDLLDDQDEDFDDDDDDLLSADLDSDDDDILVGSHVSRLGEAEAYVNFEPTCVDMNEVVGNVVEDMSRWHEQEGNTCAVCSQEFVLESLTGKEFDMDELRELAEENGWYENGTPMECVGNLLEHYGLDVDRSFHTSIQDMQNCLENGGKIIVGVDADELWSGQNEEWFFPGRDVDHAVQLIGFDHSDPDNPMVILNDSGVANGCGAVVPLDVFNDAFEDSGRFAVMAYAPQEGEFV